MLVKTLAIEEGLRLICGDQQIDITLVDIRGPNDVLRHEVIKQLKIRLGTDAKDEWDIYKVTKDGELDPQSVKAVQARKDRSRK